MEDTSAESFKHAIPEFKGNKITIAHLIAKEWSWNSAQSGPDPLEDILRLMKIEPFKKVLNIETVLGNEDTPKAWYEYYENEGFDWLFY